MNKSDLIHHLISKNPHLPVKTIEDAVKEILEQMMQALVDEKRIEIRGFGSFSLHQRTSRIGRNPRTGEAVALNAKYVPHFKAGKDLKDRVDH